jgi:hypothetical protein
MKTLRAAATSFAALTLATAANAQTIDTVATDSFDYPAGDSIDGKTGGFGWFQQYFGDAGTIETPGLDGVGGLLNTVNNNAGTFRQPKTGP